jgi:hypothetical protein
MGAPTHDPLGRQTFGQQSGTGVAVDLPDEGDVRLGVEYGDGLTGALVVTDPDVITPTGDGFNAYWSGAARTLVLEALGETVIFNPFRTKTPVSIAATVSFHEEEVAQSSAGHDARRQLMQLEVNIANVPDIFVDKDTATVNGLEWRLIRQGSANGEMRHLIFERSTRKTGTGQGE